MDNYYDYNYEVGKVIVTLKKNFIVYNESDYYTSQLLDEIDYEKVKVIFHTEKEKDDTGNIILVYLKSKDKLTVISTVTKLLDNPYVLYAEPDYCVEELIIPNDQYFGLLWGMQKIMAPSAWNVTCGSSNVAVGVIDSGINYNHPDIRDNMWSSPNGKIMNGWNFIDDNSNSMDTNGHGTNVAGIIGAVGNNHIGITGICWNIRVASLKFGLNIASAIEAIDFANRNNISILNISWCDKSYSASLKAAIDQYAGLFIVAAGNDGMNTDLSPVYPTSYDSSNIISVAAINQANRLADFSNFGVKTVHIAAPGTNILSLSLDGGYSYRNGTSMAAPHVAGAAALLKTYKTNLTTEDIKNIILSTATNVPNLAGKILTSGILNVNAMLEMSKFF